MAKLIVGSKAWVYNPCFQSHYKIVKELAIPVGTLCEIEHVAQDQLTNDLFVVEQWMLDHNWQH